MALPCLGGAGNCQIIAHQPGLGGGSSGHALKARDDPVKTIGIAGERAREGVEVADHAAQRLGVLRKDSVEPA